MILLTSLVALAAAALAGELPEDEECGLRHALGMEFDPEQPYRICGAVFDPKRGMGAVSNNANINYLGFVAWMTPVQFLRINPKREHFEAHVSSRMQAAQPIAPPFLLADRIGDEDVFLWRFRVDGHEGRSRMQTLMRLCGPDVLVPVQVFPGGGLRARHLSPHALRGATLLPDKRTPRRLRGRPVVIERFTLDRETYDDEPSPGEEIPVSVFLDELPSWAEPDVSALSGLLSRMQRHGNPRAVLASMSDMQLERIVLGVSSLDGTVDIDMGDIHWDEDREGPWDQVSEEVEENGAHYYDTSTPIIVDLDRSAEVTLNDGHHRYIVAEEHEGLSHMEAEVQIPRGLVRGWLLRFAKQGTL